MTANEAASATIQPVARPRGELSEVENDRLLTAWGEWQFQQHVWRKAALAAVEASSFRAVSEATGISTNTLQRWKREAK
jgi:hypothetical protein